MADDDNYALEAAVRLREIGFAEFTADLISKTFDAIIDANLRQTESYIDLVKEMSKTLTTYINDTKLEISNQEVLDFLGTMPPFANEQGLAITNQASGAPADSPVALAPGEQVKSLDLTAINKLFTNGQLVSTIIQAAGNPAITSLVKDGLGLVRSVLPTDFPGTKLATLFPVSDKPEYYDPNAFKALLDDATNNVTAKASVNDEAVGKLYDSVAEVIAGNKYALLQEMVKLGVLRLVVTDGVIRTSLTFSTFERESKSSSSYEKHENKVKDKYKRKQPPSRGILRLIRNRPLDKTKKTQRDVHVQTTTEQSSSSQGTNITIFGGVEIRFKTDYLPVARA